MPGKPNTNTGASGLYAVANGNVVMSSAPNGYTFRNGQAVQFDPNGSSPIRSGNWSIGTGTITYDIVDNGLLGGAFALSWAMDCGNDVIAGQVSGVPEPFTWAMIILGFAGIGRMAYQRSRRSGELATA